jgi:hypothetical protein
MVMKRDFLYRRLDEFNLEACSAQVEVCNTQIEGDVAENLKEETEMKAEEFGDAKLAQLRFGTNL